MDSKDPSTREGAVIEVANVGRGRERPVVGGNERLMRDQDWAPPEQKAHDAATLARHPVEPRTDEPEHGSVAPQSDAAAERKSGSGYARRADREDPATGLGATQSGEGQSHELPGVGGNRAGRAMRPSGGAPASHSPSRSTTSPGLGGDRPSH